MTHPSPLEAVFFAALEKGSPQERAAYLDEACAGDPGLRQRVEKMLAAQAQAGSFLEQPAERPVATVNAIVNEAPPGEVPGTVIGPYKLIEQIGEGGMGTVWMAQQTEPVHRLVAVKLIKAGMDSRQVIARFEAERQALALMDHPNIARVLDAGTIPAGRPYFVMDLVKGVPITKYCDEHHLTPGQRLELFIPICQAVQHAHQKGIIHRDLKPSNVLVALYDGKPAPKVIDFGVAKAAGQQLTDKTLVTGFGNIVGTLEYMSPEQAEINQLDIDTRSDIYSLGVLLYELLTGSPPFSRKELEKAGMLEMLRVIREQEPSKPSMKLSTAEGLPTLAANRGTEPAKLTKLMRGELDWIVMKALEKDRNRRYETANGFAMDVQRYLADEPVLACPPSAGYRLRKFVRRNKGGLAIAAMVLFFLVLLGSGVGWAVRDRSAREAEEARQRSERQAKMAGQVESIFGEVDRLEKEQKWPEALEAVRRAEAAVSGGEADATTAQRVRQRLRELELIDHLERIRTETTTGVEGFLTRAELDREYLRAFREYGVDLDGLPVEPSIDRLKVRPALSVALAAALDDWALVRRAESRTDAARWKRLAAVARGIDRDPLRDRLRAAWDQEVTPQRQTELQRLAESMDVRTQSPVTLRVLAYTLHQAQLEDSVLRILRDGQHAYPADFGLNLYLAGRLYSRKDYVGAVRFYSVAVSLRPHHPNAHDALGMALCRQNKLVEAIAEFGKAIELNPKSANAHNNLGIALQNQKKWDEATAAYYKAVELDSRFPAPHYNLGNILIAKGDLDGAERAYREADRLDGNQHNLATSALADLLLSRGKWKEAVALYRRIADSIPHEASAHRRLGNALKANGDLDGALAAYRAGAAAHEKKNPWEASSLYTAACYRALTAEIQIHARSPDAARLAKEEADRAMAWLTKALAAGFADFALLDRDADVNSLRDREDFGKLLAHLPPVVKAHNYILRSEWDKAATEYAKADLSSPLNDSAFTNACLFLIRGDREGYDRFCQDMVQRATQSKAPAPFEAFILARTCAVAPKSPVDPARAIAWANQALASGQPGWYFHALGLAQYRAGQFDQALQSFTKADVESWANRDLNWFGLALVHHRLDHPDEARQCLDKGIRWLERYGSPGPGQPGKIPPNDWVEAQLLRREAEELLKVKRSL